MSTPTMLCRSFDFAVRAAGDGEAGDGLTLAGYAAVFDQRTEIDSWEGSFVETIRRGAFKKTLRERTPVMQFDHGRHPLVGSIPIGLYDVAREDNDGLYVEGRLLDNWLIEPVRDAIANQSVNGMSFRFEVVREEWKDGKGKRIVDPAELRELLWNPGDRGPLERTLVELKVPEAGPVVFPAYAGTSVSVRAAGIADEVRTDGELRRGVLAALAAGRGPTDGLPQDPELRREVARAVLFPTRSADEPEPTDPPAAPPAPVEEPPAPPAPSTEDAPPAADPATEHPSEDPDAPPTEGHPSLTDQEKRAQYMRRAYVTRNRVGKQS